MTDLATVNVAVSPIEKFEEFLRTKGMRLTQERLLILQEVFADHEHFDVDQLVGVLEHRKERRVSRSSVYRTINLLEEAGWHRKRIAPVLPDKGQRRRRSRDSAGIQLARRTLLGLVDRPS